MRVRVWCDVRGVCNRRQLDTLPPDVTEKTCSSLLLVQNRWRDAHGLPLTIGKAPSAAPAFSFAVERHQINEIK